MLISRRGRSCTSTSTSSSPRSKCSGTATPPPATPAESAELKAALAQVQDDLTARADALKSGDLAAYAKADQQLVDDLNKVFDLQQ